MSLSRSLPRRFPALLLALGVAASLAALAACDDVEILCVYSPVALATMPQQITVAPGDSAVITATIPSRQWTDCEGRTHTVRNAVVWSSSNAAVAAVAPLDSLRARVFGVARGQTTIIAAIADEPDLKGASAVIVP
jgi:hypothetical protein